MYTLPSIALRDVQEVYAGAEGELWQLLMGEQIHIGGLSSSQDLAKRAGISPNMRGVDFCCCNGAGMRFLTRLWGVSHMTGVDATEQVINRGRQIVSNEGLAGKIDFVQAEVTATGLQSGAYDFVWGEDAWCYVADKNAMLREAVRIIRHGGLIAFTDWTAGPNPMTADEAQRFMTFMKFPTLYTLTDYQQQLQAAGCDVRHAEDTLRFAAHVELYINMVSMQLTYDALRIIGFNLDMMSAIAKEMAFIHQLAKGQKISQSRFVAVKR